MRPRTMLICTCQRNRTEQTDLKLWREKKNRLVIALKVPTLQKKKVSSLCNFFIGKNSKKKWEPILWIDEK